MTREDAKRIVDNIEIVKHFADGGEIVFPYVNHAGVVYQLKHTNTMLLSIVDRYQIAPEQTLCPVCGHQVKEE